MHDLSALTSRELARFLAEHAGQSVCVAYRTERDGTIRVRPEPRAIGIVLVALGLAACTGYGKEIEHPDDGCRDADGYEIVCPRGGGADVLVVPEQVPVEEAPVTTQDVDAAPASAPQADPVPVREDDEESVFDIIVGKVRIDPAVAGRDGKQLWRDRVDRRQMQRRERRAAREERRAVRAARL